MVLEATAAQIRGKTAKKASTSIYSYMFIRQAFTRNSSPQRRVTCSLAADKTRHLLPPDWSLSGRAAVTFDLRSYSSLRALESQNSQLTLAGTGLKPAQPCKPAHLSRVRLLGPGCLAALTPSWTCVYLSGSKPGQASAAETTATFTRGTCERWRSTSDHVGSQRTRAEPASRTLAATRTLMWANDRGAQRRPLSTAQFIKDIQEKRCLDPGDLGMFMQLELRDKISVWWNNTRTEKKKMLSSIRFSAFLSFGGRSRTQTYKNRDAATDKTNSLILAYRWLLRTSRS